MDQLILWDQQLFQFLNGLRADWLDPIFWQASSKEIWIPGYVLVIVIWGWKFGWKQAAWLFLGVLLTVGLSDLTASGILKPLTERFRPCRPEAHLDFIVHTLHDKCGGKYSFASSHAANFFGMATYFSLSFRNRWATILFFFLAIVVAYSRIYLGVHYPADILVGALIGLIWGNVFGRLMIGGAKIPRPA
ncbi:phosphatase PAP2 family protein [Pontibacter sp. G13]|uniref:phosphatase PAP2 family protein n=1 Tax=Pontibacter sp. G13 TaxID=3074898 RepID=UPI00288AA33F|nr:phosphatase PAP2 family protein [Pontibacter sp. G13]WNJ18708.1 phosphatase PAP2 family protein [Pontibacter sp. G13]